MISGRADLGGEIGWSDGRLIAENAELANRIRRLGPALASMAGDLARARRENAALKRENLRLQAQLVESGRSRCDTRGGRQGSSRNVTFRSTR